MPNNKIIDLDRLSRFKSDYDASLKTLNGVALYGGGNYTFDDEFSEVSTNAVQNNVVSLAVKEINYELAIIRESLFEVLLTEIDYKVNYAMSYVIPDTLSDDDGTHRVVYSETQLKSVEGNGVVVNQLVPNGNFADDSGWNFGTYSYTVSNNEVELVASADAGNIINVRKAGMPTINGHKYLFIETIKASSSMSTVMELYDGSQEQKKIFSTTTQYQTFATIFTATNTTNSAQFQFARTEGATKPFTLYLKNCMVIDLTNMFGAGNEPTTTDDNRIKWLLSKGYVPYNTGSLANTTISGVRIRKSELASLDLKQLGYIKLKDITWTYGYGSAFYGTINGIKQGVVYQIPNILCNVYTPATSVQGNVLANGKITVSYSASNTIIVKDNSYTDATDFKNHFTNDDYLIYELETPLAEPLQAVVDFFTLSVISIPQTNLLGALSSHDTISVVDGNIVEGEQLYNLVLTRNDHNEINVYDLNGWRKDSAGRIISDQSGYIRPENIKYAVNNNTVANIICNKYSTMSYNDVVSVTYNKTIGLDYTGAVVIWDSSYSGTNDNDEIKAYLLSQNIKMQYELATPTQTTIATDLEFDQVSSLIEQGGSVEPIFTNVPPNVETTFVVKKAVGE